MSAKYKAIIFDFDGTIARSHEQVFDVLQELAREYKLNLPTPERLRELSTTETIKELGLRIWQVPRFTMLARQKLKSRLDSIEAEPGIIELLRELHAGQNMKLGLVTSNSPENIAKLLAKFDAGDLFTEIVCGASILGKHKPLAKIIKRLRLDISDCLYVGDETRDIEACRKIGLPVGAVAWGFHSPEKLAGMNPAFLVKTVEELRAEILAEPSLV